MRENPLILTIGNKETTLRLLETLLIPQGYEILFAHNAIDAFTTIADMCPDIILIDASMENVSAHEVCRRIKNDSRTAYIPVLLISSYGGRQERLKGIEAGANEVIPKPIDKDALFLELKNALRTKKIVDALNEKIISLKELESLRDSLVHMIIHDLRSPLFGISGMLECVKMSKNIRLGEVEKQRIEKASGALSTVLNMVNSLLDVYQFEQGEMRLNLKETNLNVLIGEAIELLGTQNDKCDIQVNPLCDRVKVLCDNDLMRRVLVNLIGNAIKFTAKGDTIEISCEQSENRVKMFVKDHGPGIPREYHGKIFEKFGRANGHASEKTYSTGIGLAFCKLAIEAHNGKIGVESAPGNGSTFWFQLPQELLKDAGSGIGESREMVAADETCEMPR